MRYDVAPRVGAWIETQVKRYLMGLPRPSHPVWVRGLKPSASATTRPKKVVAPRVGAWIETRKEKAKDFIIMVAPRVGAWIETAFNSETCDYRVVAPRVGAWIETYNGRESRIYGLWSHPVWVRGLKPLCH